MTQLPSLERWALLPFLGFSYPNLLLVFLNLLLLGTLYHMFFASVGLSLGLFYFILFSCTLFWVSVPLWGFSALTCFLRFFLNLLYLGTCYIFFANVGTFSESFLFFLYLILGYLVFK